MFDSFISNFKGTRLEPWAESLRQVLDNNWYQTNNGNLPKFLNALENLPDIQTDHIDLNADVIEIGRENEINDEQKEQLLASLQALKPWRKGPFKLFGILVDSEWQSFMKWNRIKPFLSDLTYRQILDVGSGNGYYMLKMLEGNASIVAGVDPSLLSVCQFMAIQKYLNKPIAGVLPMTMEQVQPNLEAFDTVFSMGVLYHRRSPFEHLMELKEALVAGGELVLETLVIEGDVEQVLVPEGRYAMMNNIYFLPSAKALQSWMRKAGFEDIRIVDESPTTIEEQRGTDWKPGTSLRDYLDPDDPSKTVEGHPSPLRATLVAKKPETLKKLPRYKIG